MALLLVACTPDDLDALCLDAPITTWDNFGAGFVTENCRGCHHPDALDRQGAPDSVNFLEEADVLARRDSVLALATGVDPQMPPGGGTTDDDRHRLEVWLRCE